MMDPYLFVYLLRMALDEYFYDQARGELCLDIGRAGI